MSRSHASTKLTPIQVSLKQKQPIVKENQKTKMPKAQHFKIGELDKAANKGKFFQKVIKLVGHIACKKVTNAFSDTSPSSRIENSPERYKEVLLKRRNIIMRKNDRVLGTRNIK